MGSGGRAMKIDSSHVAQLTISRLLLMSNLKRISSFYPVILSVCLTGFTQTAVAQDVDPEWPCIQRLVPTVSPAVMWPVPVDESMSKIWRKDRSIRKLAERLGDLDEFTDEDRAAIESFADSIAESDKELQLSLLAVGVVDVTNRVRSQYIKGIKRYTSQQIAISQQIEDTLNELSLLGKEANSGDNQERLEIEETLRWHERVYDQRENTIRLLCEEPVELEQRLSDVLRDAAQYLP